MGYNLIGQVLVANLLGIALALLVNRFTISELGSQLPGDTDPDPTCNG